MTRDLGDLFAETLDVQESVVGPLEPTQGVRAATVRRVRRRRGRRHALEATGALAVVAVLATGGWLGLRPSPTPAPAQTPTPVPSVAPTAESAGLGLPTALPITQAVLDQIGPGWVLSVQQPVYAAPGAPTETFGDSVVPKATIAQQMLYLVSPQGERFVVPAELDPDRNVSLTSWAPGATRVAAILSDLAPVGDGVHRTAGWIDLRSGQFTPDEGAAPSPDFPDPEHSVKRGDAADGVELWEVPPEPGGSHGQIYAVAPGAEPRKVVSLRTSEPVLYVDPTGRTFLAHRADNEYDWVTIADGTIRPLRIAVPGKDCAVASWLDPGTLLATCYSRPDGTNSVDVTVAARLPGLYRVDVSTQKAELIQAADPDHPFTLSPGLHPPVARYVSDGVAVFPGILGVPEASINSSCADGVFVLSPEGLRVLEREPAPTILTTRVVGQTVYVLRALARPGSEIDPCGGLPGGDLSLTSYDPTTGASVELMPAPGPAEGVDQWISTVSSWIAQGE